MVQNLIGNALKNSGSKTMDSDIVEDGIRYGFGAVNDRKDAKMFFVIQTEEHFLSSQKKNAEGRDFK